MICKRGRTWRESRREERRWSKWRQVCVVVSEWCCTFISSEEDHSNCDRDHGHDDRKDKWGKINATVIHRSEGQFSAEALWHKSGLQVIPGCACFRKFTAPARCRLAAVCSELEWAADSKRGCEQAQQFVKPLSLGLLCQESLFAFWLMSAWLRSSK